MYFEREHEHWNCEIVIFFYYKYTNVSHFYPLKVAGPSSETQLKVGKI